MNGEKMKVFGLKYKRIKKKNLIPSNDYNYPLFILRKFLPLKEKGIVFFCSHNEEFLGLEILYRCELAFTQNV
jgi:hypothetical protein